MKPTAQLHDLSHHAQTILDRVGILRNDYLTRLSTGGMSLADFRTSQRQFFFAVTFFPRPMAALVARIPDPRQRLDILHNLVEEHGDFSENAFHHTTFQRFLDSIDADPGSLEQERLWPCVRAFNSVLSTACLLDEIEVGVACLGIIECAFAGISAIIGQSVVRNGWVSQTKLVHYALHAEIDERHADEFFAVVAPLWNDSQRRYFIEQGLELGAYVFHRLYTDLAAAVPAGLGTPSLASRI